jgi:hypothetical protein
VKEEGDSPALVLLRREDVLGQLAIGVVDDRAPSASR